ncbi:hypothetical protein TNCT_75491 [Trichonephila clavata]|uniref:Uncharacterized protein n=1 Tax=Trichonephila clavata TaxID=2740835 RepID=A0A8X6KVM2_TRICU|nr:hypothetical protein TNCT_75491 [Trichonephila clavata]
MDGYQGEIPRNISTLFRYEPKRLVANTSEPSVNCIARGSARALTNVDPFWKVFLRERAPNRETGTWSRSKSSGGECEWRREQQTKRSEPLRPKRKVKKSAPGNP